MAKSVFIGFRISTSEYEKLKGLTRGKTMSSYFREIIKREVEEDKREANDFLKLTEKMDNMALSKITDKLDEISTRLDVKKLDMIYANVDFLTVKIRELEAVENALGQITKLLQAIAEKSSGGGGGDTKMITNILYILSQLNNQYGWNNMDQKSREWMMEQLRKK